MTDEELKAALDQIIADAEAAGGTMGPTDGLDVVVKVGLVREMRSRFG